MLVDDYAEDWTQLWWARADGRGPGAGRLDAPGWRRCGTATRQYESVPLPGPVIAIEVPRWSGWSAGAG